MDIRYLSVDGDASAGRDAERRSGTAYRISKIDRRRASARIGRVPLDCGKMEAVQISRGKIVVAFLLE